jgi:hypothetical protein
VVVLVVLLVVWCCGVRAVVVWCCTEVIWGWWSLVLLVSGVKGSLELLFLELCFFGVWCRLLGWLFELVQGGCVALVQCNV